MQPQAYIHILNSCVCNYKPTYTTRVPNFSIRRVFMKIVAEAIPNHLELPQTLLFEHYKRPHHPFSKTDKIYSKKVIQEKIFLLWKTSWTKFFWLWIILVQKLLVKLTNHLGILFYRLTEENGQNQALKASYVRYLLID